jgi:uncharacterized protein DUF397
MDWSKSTHSQDANCVEWRKSTYSDGMNCVEWRKSTHSSNDGSCVEYRVDTEVIQIRDSKDQAGPVLTFTPAEWKAFTLGVKDGQFDL